MRNNKLLGLATAIALAVIALTACKGDDKSPRMPFVQNAGILEEGQVLSPGDVAHLTGEGYCEGDDVVLNFYWETGEEILPEGYLKGYKVEILERASDGMTIRLPYRKPESRVEVLLMRNGETMTVGELRMTDGTTPQEARLYGIDNNLLNPSDVHSSQITRCVVNEQAEYDSIHWSLAERPDFHSVVACWQCYGLCGLCGLAGDGDGDNRRPFFFDFCTQEWKQLGDYSTIALFSFPSGVGALQTFDGEKYTLNLISAGLEKCNYTTTPTRSPIPQPVYPLPQGLTAEQFGDYPGAYNTDGIVLFSAHTAPQEWVPVILSMYNGFYSFDSIEADGLIPFSFMTQEKEWRCGYIASHKGTANGSELYLVEKNSELILREPYAVLPGQAVSASANLQRPGYLTVHCRGAEGNATYEFRFDTKEWKPLDTLHGCAFDEIVWTN